VGTTLVAYATRGGSTRAVAEAVATTLRQSGAEVDVSDVTDVHDVDRYSTVVLGAPLYAGRFLRTARRFIRRNRSELAGMPVAVFALGPRDEDAEKWARSRDQLDRELARYVELDPVATALFGGADQPKRGVDGRDLRDWADITEWAEGLVGVLG